MVIESKIRRATRQPSLLVRAVLRRAFPNHRLLGYDWVHRADGSVTFRERGFVAANSSANLLARHNYEVACIRRILGELSVQSSLEIGCGFGRLSSTIAMHSTSHLAIDINEDAIQQARVTYPTIAFKSGSATEIPLEDGSCDLIVVWTVLQHVPPDRIAAGCAEILRVLAPGGSLLLCEETRDAGQITRGQHSWHRSVDTYAALLHPLRLATTDSLAEIDRLSGMNAPGTAMLWRSERP